MDFLRLAVAWIENMVYDLLYFFRFSEIKLVFFHSVLKAMLNERLCSCGGSYWWFLCVVVAVLIGSCIRCCR